MFNNFLWKFIFLSLGLLLPQLAMATTYFVDASVTSSGSGRFPAVAFKTIQEGVDAATADGDVVKIAAGTYEENVVFNGNDLTLWGENKHTTIIDGSSIGGVGITVDGGQTSATVIKNLQIANFTFATSGPPSAIKIEDSSPILESLLLQDNDNGIYLESTSNTVFISESSFDSNEIGIITQHNADVTIQNNIFSNNSLIGIAIEAESGAARSYATIDSNLIYGNSRGIDFTGGPVTSVATNNLIYENGTGIAVGGSGTGGEHTCTLAYNTISQNTENGISFTIYDSDNDYNCRLYNNIITGNGNYGILTDYNDYSGRASAILNYGYNDVFGNSSGNYSFDGTTTVTDEAGNISVPPFFMNASANNYRLTSDSPLIGYADTSLYSVTTDYYGNIRGDNGCGNYDGTVAGGRSDGVEIGAVECMVP